MIDTRLEDVGSPLGPGLLVVTGVATPAAAERAKHVLFRGLDLLLCVTVLISVQNDAGKVQLTKVLTDGHLGREAEGVGVPLTFRVRHHGTPCIDGPKGVIAIELERNDGGIRRSDGLGSIRDLELRLVVGSAKKTVALEEGLGVAPGVRDKEIRHAVVVPGKVVRAIEAGVASDADGFGIVPLGRGEEDLRVVSVQAAQNNVMW